MRIKPRYSVLENELSLIQDKEIRNWTRVTLANVPNYFYIARASSSGKYHPECTNKVGGLIIHIKRAVYIANRLCSGYGMEEIDKDIVISATILHDIAKVPGITVAKLYGMTVTENDFVNHPINAEKYFASKKLLEYSEDIDDTFAEEQFLQILYCIKFHMGLWSPKSIKKQLIEYTLKELLVYTADYIATTKDLVTPVDNYYEEIEYLEAHKYL